MPTNVTHVSLPLPLVEKIMNNLGEQPLKQVLPLFNELQQTVHESIQQQQTQGGNNGIEGNNAQ